MPSCDLGALRTRPYLCFYYLPFFIVLFDCGKPDQALDTFSGPEHGLGSGIPGLRDFQSDIFSGNASVRIPFEVPPGPAGFTPKLGLVYSSLGAGKLNHRPDDIGPAGIGWSVQGISTITRNTLTIGGTSYKISGTKLERFANLKIHFLDCVGAGRLCSRALVIDGSGHTYEFGQIPGAPGPTEAIAKSYGSWAKNACKTDPDCTPALRYRAIDQWTAWNWARTGDSTGNGHWSLRPTALRLRRQCDRFGNCIHFFYDVEVKIAKDRGQPNGAVTKALRPRRVVWAAPRGVMEDATLTPMKTPTLGIMKAYFDLSHWAMSATDKAQIAARLAQVESQLDAVTKFDITFRYGVHGSSVRSGTNKRLDTVDVWATRARRRARVRGWALRYITGTQGDAYPYLETIAPYLDAERPARSFVYYPYVADEAGSYQRSLLKSAANGYGGRVDYTYEPRDTGAARFFVNGVVKTKTVYDGTGQSVTYSYTRDKHFGRCEYDGWAGSRTVMEQTNISCVSGGACPQGGLVACTERRYFTNPHNASYRFSDGTVVDTSIDGATFRGLVGKLYEEVKWRPANKSCPQLPLWNAATAAQQSYGGERHRYAVTHAAGDQSHKTMHLEARRITSNPHSGAKLSSKTSYTYDAYLNVSTVDVFNASPDRGNTHERRETRSYHPPLTEHGHAVLVSRLSRTTVKARTSGNGHQLVSQTTYPLNGYLVAANGRATSVPGIEHISETKAGQGCSPLGTIENRYEFDTTYGNRTTFSIAGMLQSTITYDPDFHALISSETNAAGHTTSTTYDDRLLVTQRQFGALVTRYGYDRQGRLETTIHPTGRVSRLRYGDGASPYWEEHCQHSTNANNSTFRRCQVTAFNGWGKVVETRDAAGVSIRSVYDGLGRLVKQSLPFDQGSSPSGWTTTHYWLDGTVEHHPDGTYTHSCPMFGRDVHIGEIRFGSGEVKSCQTAMPTLRRTRQYRDALQQIIGIEQLDYGQQTGYRTQLHYDGLGRIVLVQDALSRQRVTEYDLRGNAIRVADPDRGTTHTCYGKLGKAHTTSTEASRALGGSIKTVEFDPLGRPLRREAPGGISETFTYDPHASALGKIGTHTISQTNHTVTLTSSYSNKGQILRKERSVSGQPSLAAEYTYHPESDDLTCQYYPRMNQAIMWVKQINTGRITSIQRKPCACHANCPSTKLLTSVTYTHGRTTQVNYADGSIDKRSYDASGRLTTASTHRQASTPFELRYSYNWLGDINQISETNNGSPGPVTDYSYDAFSRLQTATLRNGTGRFPYHREYAYDALGNITHFGRRNANHKYRYATNGSKQLIGGKIAGQDFGISYFANAGLISARTGSSVAYTLSYDALGRTVAINIQRPQSRSIRRYYGPEGLSRVTSASTIIDRGPAGYEEAQESGKLVRRLSIPALLGSVILEDKGQGIAAIYLHKDHLSSTRWTSGNTASVSPAYLPFGAPNDGPNVDLSATLTEGFTGQRKKEYGPLIDFRARFVDPSLGRCLQADARQPDPYNPQDNAYSYAWNNPVSFNDPSGNTPVKHDGDGRPYHFHIGSSAAGQRWQEGSERIGDAMVSGVVSAVAGAFDELGALSQFNRARRDMQDIRLGDVRTANREGTADILENDWGIGFSRGSYTVGSTLVQSVPFIGESADFSSLRDAHTKWETGIAVLRVATPEPVERLIGRGWTFARDATVQFSDSAQMASNAVYDHTIGRFWYGDEPDVTLTDVQEQVMEDAYQTATGGAVLGSKGRR